MNEAGRIYDFAFRGLLSEEALDVAGRKSSSVGQWVDEEIASRVSLDVLDESKVADARTMAAVYVAVAAFENSAREFVANVLTEAVGDDWWVKSVSERIRKQCATREEEERKHRFHTQRGSSPINYTELKNLSNIIRANADHFADFIPTPEWAATLFDSVERSRNVIMHSGRLDLEDVERLGVNIRDWVKQVGA